jgi:hypothetical protein
MFSKLTHIGISSIGYIVCIASWSKLLSRISSSRDDLTTEGEILGPNLPKHANQKWQRNKYFMVHLGKLAVSRQKCLHFSILFD